MDLSDQILIEKCKQDNVQAFRKLVEKYRHFAFAVSFRITADEEDAKDITQEAFIRLWKNLKNYREEIKFTTWFYKIVINLCFDRLRKRKTEKKIFRNYEESETSLERSNLYDVEQKQDNLEIAELIQKISNQLSPKQKAVFVLRDMENLSIHEVSQILNISEGSVKSNLVYARKHIKLRLNKIEHPESI